MSGTSRLRVALAVVLAAGALGCGEEAAPSTQAPVVEEAGPIHVHGLGVNPSDGALQGKADFHVLEAAGETVYNFGSDFQTREERLLVSVNSGKDWEQRATPRPLTDLAIDPQQPEQIVASTEGALSARAMGAGAGTPLPAVPACWPIRDTSCASMRRGGSS